MRGNKYRMPRKVKKAWKAFWRNTETPKQMMWLRRCMVMKPNRWKGVRKGNRFVAMGDTSALRRRSRRG